MMSTKFEAFQTLMMAASEANFYTSLPVYAHHVERLNQSKQPVDLLISGFTLMGAAMIVSASPCTDPYTDPYTGPY